MSQLLASALPVLLAEGGGSPITSLLPILLMFGVVYFVVLRPMSKQEKDRRKRVDDLKKGTQVVIGGGILGRISNVDDPKIAVVEIADRVKIRVLKKDIVDTQAAALAKDKDGDKAKDADKAADKSKAKSNDAESTGSDDKKEAASS